MQKTSSHSFKRKIFGLDNKFMRASTKILDLMILNILFVASCLPIITIGPAIVSLYQMSHGLKEGKVTHIAKEYFRAMKLNMKQGMLLGAVVIMTSISVFLNIQIFSNLQNLTGTFLQMITYGVGFLIFWISLYIFQISANYHSNSLQVLKNAFLLSFLHFKKTLLLLVTVAPIIFLLIYSQFTMLLTLSILLFIGFSLVAFIQSTILGPVFEQYRSNQ